MSGVVNRIMSAVFGGTTRRFLSGVLIVTSLVCWGSAAYSKSGQWGSVEKQYVHIEDLIETINAKDVDKIIIMTNTIKGMRYKGLILPFILDLWMGNNEKYPGLAWNIVNLDIIRLEVADILVQSQRNSIINLETKEKEAIHNYTLRMIGNQDVALALRAIFILEIIDDEKDVGKILSIAIAENTPDGTFRAAIITLLGMCSQQAFAAVEKLGDLIKKNERRAIFWGVKSRMPKEPLRCKQRKFWE